MCDMELIKLFERHFSVLKDKRIVIYGKGILAQLILNTFADFNIIGVLDGTFTEGNICGKPILSLEQVKECSPDIMIIAARENSIPIIYERISVFCIENHIPVYDIVGNDLVSKFDYFKRISYDMVQKEIDRHDVISFDIFDTLVMRRVLYPDDIFEIMEDRMKADGIRLERFKELRKKADEENPILIPNIYEIYDELQRISGITEDEKKKLVRLEIELEKKALLCRDDMVKLFLYALELEKEVYLVSDMYLPSEVIKEILDGLGIRSYRKIFVSCEYKETKRGKLFEILKKHIVNKTCLHIGDNEVSDGLMPVAYGITPRLVKSTVELLKLSLFASILENFKTVNERTMVGLFGARIFNSPFALFEKDKCVTVKNTEDLIYLFAAPILSTFLMWILKQVECEEYDGILFAARDGFVLKEMYGYSVESLGRKESPASWYLKTSRRACTLAAIIDDSDIKWLAARNFEGTDREMLKECFGLWEDDILTFDNKKFKNRSEYILAHKDIIMVRSEEKRRAYLEYIKRIGLQKDKKYIFVDMVSSGTSQCFFEKIIPFSVRGKYFCNYKNKNDLDGRLNRLAVDALYPESVDYNLYVWMEVFMTSMESSFVGIDADGNEIYAKESRTSEEKANIRILQEALLSYFKEYLQFWSESSGLDKALAQQLLCFMGPEYIENKTGFFQMFSLKDDFSKNKVELSERTWHNGRSLIYYKYLKEDYQEQIPEPWEEDLKKYVENNNTDNFEAILMKDERWEIFKELTELRTSILNWYDFKEGSNVLEVGGGFGALTGLLCQKCTHVVTVEERPFCAEIIQKRYHDKDNLDIYVGSLWDVKLEEKFDYIVVIGYLEWAGRGSSDKADYVDYLNLLKRFLKEDGKIIIAVENRYGIRYFCGECEPHTKKPFSGINHYPYGTTGYSFSRQELIEILEQSGLRKYKFYYPMPDYVIPQMVFSQDYLPKKNVKERLLCYHREQESLIAFENKLYEDIIDNGVFEFFSNSFLVECTVESEFDKAVYAAITTDRGYYNALATIIRSDDTVIKKALYPGGIETIKRIYNSITAMKNHGVQVLPHKIVGNDTLIMPYEHGILLSEYLSNIVKESPQYFIDLIEELYQNILKSSEHVHSSKSSFFSKEKIEDIGVILKDAYIDMIPLNCFYIDHKMVFFDQEFLRENYPAKYTLFRALKYIYLFNPEINDVVPLEELKLKFQLINLWDAFIEEENTFVAENRRYGVYQQFYKYVWIDEWQIYNNADKLQNK